MRINNNITALNAHRNYGINNASIAKNVEKLSSGYRINRAGDDAAGLAISEKMRAQIRGLNMASKNSQDAVSLIQTAEGALQSTHDILQRMRELAVQSASDTNEQTIDRGALQQEFEALKAEVNDIAGKTRFNDQNLIDGTFSKNIVSFNSNTDATTVTLTSGSNIRVSATGKQFGEFAITASGTPAASASTSAGTAAALEATGLMDGTTGTTGAAGAASLDSVDYTGPATSKFNGNDYTMVVDDQGGTNVTFRLMDSAGKTVATSKAHDIADWNKGANETNKVDFGAYGSFDFKMAGGKTVDTIRSDLLGTNVNGQKITFDTTSGKDAVITPAKEASVDITLNGETKSVKLGDTSVTFDETGVTLYFDGGLRDTDIGTATASIGASLNGKKVSVDALAGQSLIIQTGANQGDEVAINIDKMNATALGIQGSTISTREMASNAITEVNNALNQVSTQRAALGALQNRMEFKIANLDTSAENLQAAESRIRDVDMAKEMTSFSKNNILAQASTAMLAQANALPQGVLQLLG